MEQPKFATFWHGDELSPYELACLLSFINQKHDLVIYTYGRIRDLPDSLPVRDAREIIAPDAMQLFAVGGKPSVSHFTDYFRFVMFTKTRPDLGRHRHHPVEAVHAGRHAQPDGPRDAHQRLHRGAAPRPGRPRLAQMIARVETLSTQRLKWGDTGPRLLDVDVRDGRRAAGERVLSGALRRLLQGVSARSTATSASALCADATTLHLLEQPRREDGAVQGDRTAGGVVSCTRCSRVRRGGCSTGSTRGR